MASHCSVIRDSTLSTAAQRGASLPSSSVVVVRFNNNKNQYFILAQGTRPWLAFFSAGKFVSRTSRGCARPQSASTTTSTTNDQRLASPSRITVARSCCSRCLFLLRRCSPSGLYVVLPASQLVNQQPSTKSALRPQLSTPLSVAHSVSGASQRESPSESYSRRLAFVEFPVPCCVSRVTLALYTPRYRPR